MPELGLTRDEKHEYTAWYPPAPPVVLPGVTSVLGMIAKPWLQAWYAKNAAQWAADNLGIVAQLVADLGTDAAATAISKRATVVRDAAGDRGTLVHAMAEARFLGLPVIAPEPLQPYLDNLDRWVDRTEFHAEHVEVMVANEFHGYAGTLDVIGRICRGPFEGMRVLVDVKTSSRVSPDMGLQLAAYRWAHYIGLPGDATKVPMPIVDASAILHVTADDALLYPFANTDDDREELDVFLSALRIYRWTRERAKEIMGDAL